jgi:hypothetical protein
MRNGNLCYYEQSALFEGMMQKPACLEAEKEVSPGMNRKELEAELQRLQHDLEDLEETIGFNLLNTSAHISGRQVRKDEESLSALRERIAGITRLLQARQR